jgi:hypothetical protein
MVPALAPCGKAPTACVRRVAGGWRAGPLRVEFAPRGDDQEGTRAAEGSALREAALALSSLPSVFETPDFASALRVTGRSSPLDVQTPEAGPVRVEGLASRLRELRRSIEALPDARTGGAGPGATRSGPLGLETEREFTTLVSTDEANAIPTSFSPAGPAFTGASAALPTVGGTYSGALGDQTLTFLAKDAGTIGVPSAKKLRIDVRDQTGVRIETLNFQNLDPDTPLALSSGLSLSFSGGAIVKNDGFTVAVSATTGSRVDPAKPFDGTRNDGPGFEPGLSVREGSFQLNGVTIAVGASDTLEQVLDRITSSAAGVHATFDAASETVVLTRKTGGSLPIVVEDDTSGFLAATKLSGAIAVLGGDGDEASQPLAEVPELSGIAGGSFSINGVTISVDANVDSLRDVASRISASAAGATAVYDERSGVFEIRSSGARELVLSDGDSGLWSALGIAPGTYRGTPRAGAEDDVGLRTKLHRVFRALDAVLGAGPDAAPPELRETVRGLLHSALRSAYAAFGGRVDGDRLLSGIGLDADLRSDARRVLSLDAGRLRRAGLRGADDLERFLFGAPAARRGLGLVRSVLEAVHEAEERVRTAARERGAGSLVNVRV